MENSQYVGFSARLKASIVDTTLFILIIFPIYYLVYGNLSPITEEKTSFFTIVLQYIFPFVATLLFWIYKSATPGKMLIKAVIVDATTYKKPTTKQLIIRNLSYYLSLLPLGLGYFWIIWDKRKQGWHDKLANTIVIQPKTEEKSMGFTGYLLRGLGLLAIFVFLGLIVIGLMVELEILPNADIYKSEKLSKNVRQEILDKKLLNTLDDLLYLQADSSFSFTEEGTLFTKKGISVFSTTDDGNLINDFFDFKDIASLTIGTMNDLDILGLDWGEDTLGIKLLIIYIYDEENKLLSYPIISIKSKEKENFEKEILKLWSDSRELEE